jgi:hypothetical protein
MSSKEHTSGIHLSVRTLHTSPVGVTITRSKLAHLEQSAFRLLQCLCYESGLVRR